MQSKGAERLAPLSGTLFAVLYFVSGFVLLSDAPAFLDTGSTAAAWFTDSSGQILGGITLALLGVVALIWFGGTLRELLSEAGAPRIGGIALGGAVAAGALIAAGAIAWAVGALRAEEEAISPEVATVYLDLGYALIGAAAPAGAAAMMAAVGVGIVRTKLLPVALGWIALVVALGLLVPPISYAFMWAFALWIAVAGALLFAASREHG